MAWGRFRLEFGRRTHVMAIVNVTPDSFSGDGLAGHVGRAVERIHQAVREGATIVDVGGESTRPGYEPVSGDEELARVLPVIERATRELAVPISIDTSKAAVAEAALAAGAGMVNDVRGLAGDSALTRVVARHGVPAVITHDISLQSNIDIIPTILRQLHQRTTHAIDAGIDPTKLIIDPGFGFGKDWRQNLELLRRLGELRLLGFPILVGLSRKRTIGQVLGLPPEERLEGTLATTALAIANGADIVRVHDVLPNVRVARMADAVVRGVEP